MECVEVVSLGFATTKKVVAYLLETDYKNIHPRSIGVVGLAIEAAKDLGFLNVSSGSIYDADLSLTEPLPSTPWDEPTKRALFRKHLQQYEPYVKFHSFLDIGNSVDSAARRVSIYYEITPLMSGEENTLAGWGLYAGTLIKFDEIVQIAPAVKSKSIMKAVPNLKSFLQAMDTEIGSRVFIQTFLGQQAYDFLTEDVKKDLVESMTLALSRPEDAVRSMGRALEDYVKLLAKDRSVRLEEKGKPISTIGAMINKLRSEGCLANHHKSTLNGLEVYTDADLFHGLSAYRAMPVHGVDPDADMRWSLSTEVAIVGTLQLLLSIRSTYHYVVDGKLSY